MVVYCWQISYTCDNSVYGSSIVEEPSSPSSGGSIVEEPSFPEEPQQPEPPGGGNSGSGSTNQPSAPSTGTPSSGNSGGGSSGSSSTSGSVSSGSGAAGSGTAASSGGASAASQSSADTRLSQLQINCGTLVPEFSPDQYEYTVYVEYNGEAIDCGTTATAAEPSVSVRAEGPSEITGEDAQKTVIAEADDGGYSEYVINIHVVKDNEILEGNALYVISQPRDVGSLPGDFREDETEFASEAVKVARSSDENICLLYYVNTADENDALWYILNEETGTVYPAEIVEYDGRQYLSLSSANDLLYGEHDGVIGYFIIDPDTGEILLSLNGGGEQENASASSVNRWIIIGTATVIALLALCCALICSRFYLRAKDSEKQEKKYFRPYLSPDAEYMAEKDSTKEQADHT